MKHKFEEGTAVRIFDTIYTYGSSTIVCIRVQWNHPYRKKRVMAESASHEGSLNSDISAMQLYLRAQADWAERTHVMFPRLDPRQIMDFGLTR